MQLGSAALAGSAAPRPRPAASRPRRRPGRSAVNRVEAILAAAVALLAIALVVSLWLVSRALRHSTRGSRNVGHPAATDPAGGGRGRGGSVDHQLATVQVTYDSRAGIGLSSSGHGS